jgi:hypothetical protein
MTWPALKDAIVPHGCVPCRFCDGHCMKAEGVEDWHGRGFVIRIYSMCDAADAYDKDDIRTEFLPADEAVEEWNRMQSE